jgi:hypothetical protein
MHAMDLDSVIDAALGRLRGPHDVPDTTVLPAQFFPRSVVRPPERRLMMAVLARALLDLQTHAGTGTPQARRHLAAVEGWFGSDDDVWPFSFVNLCHALALDAAAVRSRLGPWRQGAQPKVVRFPIPAADEAARLARTG